MASGRVTSRRAEAGKSRTRSSRGDEIAAGKTIGREIAGHCLMARARYLSRVLTSVYDDEVRALGIQASQITLLAAIASAAPVRRTDLGRLLHFDSSTLTRNLKVMLLNGWIADVVDPHDERAKLLDITREGATLLTAVQPAWRRAQAKAEASLGADGREVLSSLFTRLAAQQD